MKRIIHILLIVVLFTMNLPTTSVLGSQTSETTESTPESEANGNTTQQPTQEVDALNLQVRSAVLMDVDTGQVLYSKNDQISLPPASVTKVMTMLVIMEAIEKGIVSWDDMVTTSEKAHSMTGSQVFLAIGEKATLKQMFEAIAVYSANDAAVALAEHVAGSEDLFVNLMNEKAQELGLRNTRYLNATGFPYTDRFPNFNEPSGHTMSAMDIAVISRELVSKYPDVLEHTRKTFATFQNGVNMPTRNNIMLRNDWIDGLKTGFTDQAQYCLSATGEKNGFRLVSVILGAANDRARQDETLKLLNFGFNNYERQTMIRGKEEVKVVKVDKGKEREVALLAAQNLNIVVDKEGKHTYNQVIEINESIVAPILANTVLGRVYYERDGVMIGEPVSLVAKEDVEKAGFLRLLGRGIKDTFVGIFEGIADKILGIFSKE
ncbi:hypothetical protein BHU72_10630 [Desulfuribacillus stibiiarsenatis]|uniref:serine-type D-Ala-D-Ala carboxypeptidase n=1 Tax=Desulfuribacillus stibiiarsenatis TaxID=1390249 RepID=A0A1E5L278_9FIRM|nr:D-alanyl-D-alanine carboxypeptidase family protein [Desulfuribacillus stibiiarsenatis]OEH84262.1 hypothetical protein BHU72_10630 [Desulfuribacillus stibiiarsenatis]